MSKKTSSKYYVQPKGVDKISQLQSENSILKNIVNIILPIARDHGFDRSEQVCHDINSAIDEAISQGMFIPPNRKNQLYAIPKGFCDWDKIGNRLVRDKKRLETARLIR